MADNVSLPVDPGPVEVATDEVDLGGGAAHVQFTKVVDGTDGGTNRLLVTGDGGVHTTARVLRTGGTLSTGTAGPYADGDVIGSPLVATDLPSGLYRVTRLALASVTGVDLPPLMVALVPTPTSGTWTTPVDDAPFAFDLPSELTLAANAVIISASDFTDLPGTGGTVQVCTDGRPIILNDFASDLTFENLVDLNIVFVADGATSYDFATNAVGVVLTLLLVGDQAA